MSMALLMAEANRAKGYAEMQYESSLPHEPKGLQFCMENDTLWQTQTPEANSNFITYRSMGEKQEAKNKA